MPCAFQFNAECVGFVGCLVVGCSAVCLLFGASVLLLLLCDVSGVISVFLHQSNACRRLAQVLICFA